MKRYPDPQEFMEQHLQQARQRHVQGILRAGITQPSGKLIRRLAERDVEEGERRYIEEVTSVLDHNIGYIRRRGDRICAWLCLPMAGVFGLAAWYCFACSGDVATGVVCVVAGLVFLSPLVWSVAFGPR
jgi:hypothetical protein